MKVLGVPKKWSIKIGKIAAIKLCALPNITCILWICNGLLRAVCARILSFFGLAAFASYLAAFVIYTPLLLYIIWAKKIPWKYFHWVLLLCAGFFSITLLIHPDYARWYFRDSYGVMQLVFSPDRGAIWGFLMIEISGTVGRLWNNLRCSAWGIGIYNIYLFLQARSLGYWEYMNSSGVVAKRSYSLEFGYSMMFVLFVSFVCFELYQKRIYKWICVISFVLMLCAGSRGAFICLCVFLILYLFFKKGKITYKIAAGAGIVAAGGTLYLLYNEMVLLLNLVLERVNIQSRTLQMLISGETMDDSGRSRIYQLIWSAIKENPVLGYGAFGDRQFIAPQYNWGYSHSILYELMADFGIPLGILILVLLVVWSLLSIVKCKNKLMLYVMMILFSMSARLLISNTFWGDPYFWMLLAALVLNLKMKKRRKP